MEKIHGWRLLAVGIGALSLVFALGCEREESRDGLDYEGDRAQRDVRDAAAVVEITDREFKPKTVTVKVGDTVMWKNTSRDTHSVNFDPLKFPEKFRDEWKDYKPPEGVQPFKSGDVKPGDSWKHPFTMAGTYHYWCGHHEEMTGTITVQPRE